MERNSGHFGKLAKNYKEMRPGYPNQVIRDIYTQIKNFKPAILDLGCGTGISTRQLAKRNVSIIGCDVDSEMIKNAKTDNQKNIKYVKGNAEKLPFPCGCFDGVTMFTSFHWFTNKKALSQIRRVLKPNGIIFIVQPRYKSPLRRDLRQIINKALKLGIKPRYSTKKFSKVLSENKFRIIKTKVYKTINKYTLNQFIKLMQSISTWAYVPVSQQKNILGLLKIHYGKMLKNNKIYDPVEVQLICAKNMLDIG